MRVPKGVNAIAIFGRTCVGKSTVAQQLAGLIGSPIRHCGEILKQYAQTAGTSVANLSLQDHQEVDNETRRIATQEANVIVEGGFLDIVLQGLKNTVFVRLTCNETEREHRFRSKHLESITLEQRDEQDAALRYRLYGEQPLTEVAMIDLDTTQKSAQEAALELRNAIERLHNLA